MGHDCIWRWVWVGVGVEDDSCRDPFVCLPRHVIGNTTNLACPWLLLVMGKDMTVPHAGLSCGFRDIHAIQGLTRRCKERHSDLIAPQALHKQGPLAPVVSHPEFWGTSAAGTPNSGLSLKQVHLDNKLMARTHKNASSSAGSNQVKSSSIILPASFSRSKIQELFLPKPPLLSSSRQRSQTIINNGDAGFTHLVCFTRHRALYYPPSRALVVSRASEGVAWYVVGFSRLNPPPK